MKRFSWLLLVVIFALLHFLDVAPAPALEVPWTAYFGSQDQLTPWAQTVRGVGRGKTGMALIEKSEQVNMGPASEFALLEKQVIQIITSRDMIIQIGGLRAAREQDEVNAFMNMIKKDGGKLWKEVVVSQAVRFAKLPHGYERIYWQVGNEINSKAYGRTLSRWAGQGGAQGHDDPISFLFMLNTFWRPLWRRYVQQVFKSPVQKTKFKSCWGRLPMLPVRVRENGWRICLITGFVVISRRLWRASESLMQ